MRKENRVSVLLVLFLLGLFNGMAFPCTMVLAGKGATADGSVLLAHNNDLPGNIGAMIQIVPAKRHDSGEMIVFKNGLEIPQAQQTFRMLIMQCYYGFAEGDAKAVNQYGVAVAGGVSLKHDRNQSARELDPLVKKGVSGYVRYIALQRSKTARECVQLIGKMYSQYGISYPSGVGVADADEVWYIEAGGGKCWAAKRVPDDSYLVAANGYRIGRIDFKDKQNFIYPSYLKDYAVKKRLWKPGKDGKNPFHFARIFGRKVIDAGEFYNARRVWRAQQLLTPSVKKDPDAVSHPWCLKPDKKLTVPQLIAVLRDFYKGTPFDISKRKLREMGDHKPAKKERAIGVFNTVHTSVIQLRGGMPTEIGAVLWGGVSSSLTTPFIPFYFGIEKIPAAFLKTGPLYDEESAFWRFRTLTLLLEPWLPRIIDFLLTQWHEMERQYFSNQPALEKNALEIFNKDPKKAREFLTTYSYDLAAKALAIAKKLEIKLKTLLAESSNRF